MLYDTPEEQILNIIVQGTDNKIFLLKLLHVSAKFCSIAGAIIGIIHIGRKLPKKSY